jgi:hypothetical protein
MSSHLYHLSQSSFLLLLSDDIRSSHHYLMAQYSFPLLLCDIIRFSHPYHVSQASFPLLTSETILSSHHYHVGSRQKNDYRYSKHLIVSHDLTPRDLLIPLVSIFSPSIAPPYLRPENLAQRPKTADFRFKVFPPRRSSMRIFSTLAL